MKRSIHSLVSLCVLLTSCKTTPEQDVFLRDDIEMYTKLTAVMVEEVKVMQNVYQRQRDYCLEKENYDLDEVLKHIDSMYSPKDQVSDLKRVIEDLKKIKTRLSGQLEEFKIQLTDTDL